MAVLHAIGLSERGHNVTFYSDVSMMDPDWIELLQKHVELRDLPYGFESGSVLREMERFDSIIVHHHVEPIIAFRIAHRYKQKTAWYIGELTRAIWERQLSGTDYREFSPSVFQTARHFYGPVSSLALFGPFYRVTAQILQRLDRMTIQLYRVVIANSQYTATMTRRVLGYERSIPVVYPASGIPSSMFHPNYENGEFLLAVGALQPHKNHDALFKAVATLKNPPPLCLIGDGQERSSLEELARRLPIDVEFHTRVTDEQLCKFYERSLLVAVSAFSEAFGMTPVEGALAGKTSVVGGRGGTKEFVLDGETGFVVNPTSYGQIADALELLIRDKALRERMGRKARERALNNFTLDRSVECLLRALE